MSSPFLTLEGRVLIVKHCLGVRAQSSLYIPGFDPQAISVDQVGVGADGRTTYVLQPGTPTDTDEDVGFFGTGQSKSISFIPMNFLKKISPL